MVGLIQPDTLGELREKKKAVAQKLVQKVTRPDHRATVPNMEMVEFY